MNALMQSLGGVGLFLFGMAVMSSGLRKVAGDRLRLWLQRSTRRPINGVMTGAGATALLQSSSATTVAAIGFVSAGLLTFPQALGVIFGANIGTTLTGWIVALVGFKLKLGAVAFPIIFVSSLFYLFKSSRLLRGWGKALAGFCLIFIGIGILRDGLASYQSAVDLSGWSIDHLGGRLLLVLFGVFITMITQSSSATVATAVTALHADILTLPQSAVVIIGADIGTTATAALATIGGSVQARRTGFAHVIYNILTGIAALVIVDAYLWCSEQLAPNLTANSPEVIAVGFHSFFNILGVALVIPFTHQFARLICRIFPDNEPNLSAPFAPQLLGDSGVALVSLENGVRRIAADSLSLAVSAIRGGLRPESSIDAILTAVEKAREFAVKIGEQEGDSGSDTSRIFAALHILDHVERLLTARIIRARTHGPRLRESASKLADLLEKLGSTLSNSDTVPEDLARQLQSVAEDFETDKSAFRNELIGNAVRGMLQADEMDQALDAHRWLRRVAHHGHRIAEYAR